MKGGKDVDVKMVDIIKFKNFLISDEDLKIVDMKNKLLLSVDSDKVSFYDKNMNLMGVKSIVELAKLVSVDGYKEFLDSDGVNEDEIRYH